MTITTHYISDYEYEAATGNGHKVTIDMKREKKSGQSPMEMVLSALTGCIAVEISGMVKKRKKTLTDLIIEANATRREQNPKSFTHIDLKFILVSPDAELNELEKIANLGMEKYCSVSDSLKAEIAFSCEVRRP